MTFLNTIRSFAVLLWVWIFLRIAVYAIPGDPADFLAHESLIPLTTDQIRSALNLDPSPIHRLFTLPNHHSLIHDKTVIELLVPAIQNTLKLTALTVFFTTIFLITSLFLSFRVPRIKPVLQNFALFFAAAPISVLGPIAVFLFAIQFSWFPLIKDPWLPSLCLAASLNAFWFRSIQRKVDHFLPTSPVLGSLARGATEWRTFWKALFFPILGSIASYLGTQLGHLLSGSVIVEIIFQWNGIGTLLLKAVRERDYPVIEVTLIFASVATVISQQMGYFLQNQINPNRQFST